MTLTHRILGIIIASACLTLSIPVSAVDKDGNFVLVISLGMAVRIPEQ